MNTQSFVSNRSLTTRPFDRPSSFAPLSATRPATLSGKELRKIVADLIG